MASFEVLVSGINLTSFFDAHDPNPKMINKPMNRFFIFKVLYDDYNY